MVLRGLVRAVPDAFVELVCVPRFVQHWDRDSVVTDVLELLSGRVFYVVDLGGQVGRALAGADEVVPAGGFPQLSGGYRN